MHFIPTLLARAAAILWGIVDDILKPVPRARLQLGGLDIGDPAEVKAALDRISDSVKARDHDTAELQSRLTELEQRAVRQPGGGGGVPGAMKADLSPVLQHASLERLRAKAIERTDRVMLESGIKALVNAGDDADSNRTALPTLADRVPGLFGFTLRPLSLLDVMPSIPTTSNMVEFVQIKATGDADVQIDEGDEKAEMSFDGELKTAKVSTIAVHTTVSAQVLDDNNVLQQELQRIMNHGVRAKLEEQLISGAGTTGRIDGLYTQAAEINSNRDPFPERIGDALQQMETLGYTPNVVLLNPADWFDISMLKDSLGRYIYGNPSSPARPSLFNRPVVTSPSIPLHRALIGDTAQAPIRDRMQPSVLISREHKDYASRNLVLILVELRAGLTLLDTGAFRRVSLDPRS